MNFYKRAEQIVNPPPMDDEQQIKYGAVLVKTMNDCMENEEYGDSEWNDKLA